MSITFTGFPVSFAARAKLFLHQGQAETNHSRYSDRDVKSAVKEADIVIYAVGTYDRYANTQEEFIRKLATDTGSTRIARISSQFAP